MRSTKSVYSEIDSLMENAEKTCADIEPWNKYFIWRGHELKVFLSLCGIETFGSMLEIGCGNAFNSAVLSGFCAKVVATDLPKEDISTHSLGINRPAALLSRLNIRNVYIIPCPAEKLPFKDNTFDTVFSSYVLEHVSDKGRTIRETARVLKPGGICIAIVPNFAGNICDCFFQYKYLAQRFLYHSARKQNMYTEPANAGQDKLCQGSEGMSLSKFRKNYPHFPFPEPHGNYKNILAEIFEHMPFNWINKFKRNNMQVESVFTTIIMPWNLIGLFSGTAPLHFYRRTPRFVHILGKWSPLKYFGTNLCVIARKI